jgi:integrase
MARARRTKGTGSVFLRGRIWWITYTRNGLPIPESSRSTDREEAERLLRQRLGELAIGKEIAREKATINDLCALVIADYRLQRKSDLKTIVWRHEAHIKNSVGPMLAGKFGTKHAREYILARRAAGAADATINRELSILRRGFTLGRDEEPPLVARVPKIPKLEEDNVRQGFLEHEQYEHLLGFLPQRLKALFVCAYHVGTRKGELRKIRIDQVDFDAGVIRVEKKQTKGKKPRTLPIYGDMERWLRERIDSAPAGWSYVFHNGHGRRLVGKHMDGWSEACEAAGLPGLLFHDLRRSAVRNMKRAGVSETVGMRISGHKTRSIYDRYDIVDEMDLENAGTSLTNYFSERKKKRAAKLKVVGLRQSVLERVE